MKRLHIMEIGKGFGLATGFALLLLAVPLWAQPAPNRAEEVRQIVGSLPTAIESPTDEARRSLLYAIARALNVRGDCCWGVLVKTDQGNKIPADILVWRPTLEHFDVLTGGVASASWDPKGPVTNVRWIWQAPDAAAPDPGVVPAPIPVPPPTPIPVAAPPLDLSGVIAAIQALAVQTHTDHQAIIDAVNEPSWVKRIFSNRYVQLAGAVIGTCLSTTSCRQGIFGGGTPAASAPK